MKKFVLLLLFLNTSFGLYAQNVLYTRFNDPDYNSLNTNGTINEQLNRVDIGGFNGNTTAKYTTSANSLDINFWYVLIGRDDTFGNVECQSNPTNRTITVPSYTTYNSRDLEISNAYGTRGVCFVQSDVFFVPELEDPPQLEVCNDEALFSGASRGMPRFSRWEYSINGINYQTITNPTNPARNYNTYPITASASRLFGPDFTGNLYVRFIFEGALRSKTIEFNIIKCSPELDNVVSVDETCNSSNNGEVTLTFAENIDEADGYEMRYFIFQGDPNDIVVDPISENRPPQAFDEIRFSPDGGNSFLVPNADNSLYSGTYSGLDGANNDINAPPAEINQQDYFVVYQEVRFDEPNVGDVDVKSGEIIPNAFTIRQPTQVEISGLTVTQPPCPESKGTVIVNATGGGFLPNPNVTLQYGIQIGTEAITWQPTNTFTELDPANYKFYASTNTNDLNCQSAEQADFTEIDPAPIFEFDTDNTREGQDPSPGESDGTIEVELNGGTSPITLEIYNDAATPTFVQSTSLTGTDRNHIFSGLPAGTFYIQATDANLCPITSPRTYELQSAPIPQLEEPVPTNPFCDTGTDGSVSFVLTNPINPYQYRILDIDNGNNIVDSGGGAAAPSELVTIPTNNLAASNYRIEVIYNTGNFTIAATVASRTFIITDPAEITVSLTAIEGLDCNGTSNGYIEIAVSEAGNFQYTYRTLSTWIDLDTNGRIPITQAGTYNDIQVRKLRDPSDITGCTSTNELDDILVPAGLLITEISSQNVSTSGGSNGSLEIEVTGGTPNYTYAWTRSETSTSVKLPFTPPAPNSTNTNLVNIPAGFYEVTVTDVNNCSSVLDPVIEISEPGPLSIDDLTGTNTCNGLETGTITATVQGTGDITFEFLLNPGPSETVLPAFTTPDRTVTISDLATGTYGLRITEVTSGNVATTPTADYVIITELTPVAAVATPTTIACNEFNTGVITITEAVGGSGTNFEYAIDDGFGFQAGNTFTGLAPRIYTVTVRDDLGCEFTTTTEIIQDGAPVLDDITTVVTNASSDTNLDGSIVLEFETDATNYTYAWTGPNVTDPSARNQTSLGEGTYQVVVTAPGNCTLPRTFTVGIEDAFAIQNFTGTPTCFEQATGSLTANIAATGSVTFNWFNQNDPITPVATETTNLRTLSTTGLTAGTYYLEIEGEAGQTAQSTTFEILDLPQVFANVNLTPTCIGEETGTITFSGQIGSLSGNYTYSIDNGATFQPEPLFEDLAPGPYTPLMRAAENPSCDFIAPGVTIGTSPGLFFDLDNSTITRASGPGAEDGAISAAFIGGTGPFTFEWTPNPTGSNTANITGLGAGTYTLTITGAANCPITEDFEVTEVGPLTISNVTPTNATCRGEANGSITTTVTGEGNINFQWTLANGDPVPVSNGVNEQNLTGILAGSYVLIATDDNATQSTAAITITEPVTTATITNITATDVSCFGGNDGTLEVQADGGTAPYTYSINGGAFQTSPIFTNLFANSYTVRVQDVNGCEFIEPTPVLIIEPEELNLIVNEQRTVTAANATDGAIFITVEGGSGNYTFQWTGPNGYTSTDEDILNIAAGDYNLTVTDANFGANGDAGCRLVTSQPITITEPGELLATVNQTILLSCFGDDFAEITATVQGGVPPFTYQWFQIVSGNNTLLNEETDMLGGLTVGTYFVRATDANLITDDSNPIIINAPSLLQVVIDNTTNVLCTGQPTGAINITASGGTPPYQYLWNNAATVADINNLEAGVYTVDIEDAAGCLLRATATITAPNDAIQIADATITNTSAYQTVDGSISLDIQGGSGSYTYIWTRLSDNSNVGNTATISNLAADSYTVLVSDTNGCDVIETYEVTQPDIVEETIIQPSCTDEADGSITVVVNQGNDGAFTYVWNTGAIENNITNLPAGSYTVTVTGFADGPVTRTYVLENPVPLEVNLGADRVLCAGQTLALDATVADETASYSWTSDTGFSSTEPMVELTQSGNYTVTVQSQLGCTTQGTIFVAISTDEIDAEFAMSSQVFVSETAIAVDISYPLPDGIEWIVPIGAEILTQNQDAAEFSFAEAGEYEITMITTRGNCIAQKTKKILVISLDGLIQEDDDKNGRKLVEDFIVYPNPTTGRFTADVNLTAPGDISIKVFNFTNNTMMASERARGSDTYQIPFDISGMPSGVYAVLLETPYGTSLRKIVVR